MITIIKGNFIFTPTKDQFEVKENHYIIIQNGKIKGLFQELPDAYTHDAVTDFGDQFIIPGFVDLHTHAPQWTNCGIGYSKELVPWLNEYTFPLEGHFDDEAFGKKAYQTFLKKLWEVGTTRVCVMATKHKEATAYLIDCFKNSGLGAYVGKVNMDRNATDYLNEITSTSIQDTLDLIHEYEANDLVHYIVSPRFVPSTTPKLMQSLGEIAETYHLPIQSHLCENRDEVKWVHELHPNIPSFTEVYKHFGLLRPNQTIMAHCIYNTPAEIDLLEKMKVTVAHCAQSNFNLASGIMPLRHYLDRGIHVGLGSDVGAGHSLNMKEHIIATIQASKMYWVTHPEDHPLSTSEAFYLATKGGGRFFGKVGSFEKDYEFDALVIDDTSTTPNKSTLEERLEQFIYTGSSSQITKRYVRGKLIKQPIFS